MGIEEKLDRIIELLEGIDKKIVGESAGLGKENFSEIENIKAFKPIPAQLRNQRVVEMANRMDRKSFLKIYKRDILEILEIHKTNPDFYPVFQPQSLGWFAKFKNPHSPFYIQLKKDTVRYCDGVTQELRRMIDNFKNHSVAK